MSNRDYLSLIREDCGPDSTSPLPMVVAVFVSLSSMMEAVSLPLTLRSSTARGFECPQHQVVTDLSPPTGRSDLIKIWVALSGFSSSTTIPWVNMGVHVLERKK